MNDTPPPAASDAIEAALKAMIERGCQFGANFQWQQEPAREMMRSAIAAYHAALPSEFGELTENLSDLAKAVESTMGYVPGKSVNIFRQSVAAITALEAKFEYFGELARLDHEYLIAQRDDARKQLADAYERCAKIAENACLVPPDGGSPTEHANLKQELSGFSPYSLGGLSLAAITALESRLADAYERCAKIAENACLVPPDGGSPTEGEADVAEAAARAIRALPAKE